MTEFKIYKDIIQGSDEWKELRWGKVGGSSLKHVMANYGKPVEDNAIFFELLGQMTEEFEIDDNDFVSSAMDRGNILESDASDLFSRIYGKECFEIGWAQINDFVGISPDRLIGEISMDVTEAAEFKCPAKNTYAKYLCNNDLAVEDYSWQLVDYFLVFKKLTKLNFMPYRPESKIKNHILIEITPDTIINVSKKLILPVYQLVEKAEQRLEELKTALDNKIESLTVTKF